MKLLKYEGYKLTFEPEILTLRVFRNLHNRDKSKDKNRFIQELGFIYFFADPRSDYQYITDEVQRLESIIEGEGLPNDWEPDTLLIEAVKFYESFKTTSALLLEDTRYAVDKLRTLLREIDLNQTDDKGKPIYTLNMVTSTIKQVPSLVRDLDEAERTLAKEIIQSERIRGTAEKAIYEDM